MPLSRWRLLVPTVLVIAFLALVFVHPGVGGTSAQALSYTNFVSDVTANKVSTAAITAAGSVSGKLSDGSAYTAQIPVALNDNALPALLLAHKVQVTGTTTITNPWPGLLEWIVPFLLVIGFFVWMGRRSSKQFTGRMGAIMGFGQSKAKVYDEDRPSTRFADIAGYEGSKAEVMEVVESTPWPSTRPGTRWWRRCWSTPIPSRRSRSFPVAPLLA
jgi:cell division protease FtsH